MKPVLIVQHIPREHPGLIRDVLAEHNVPCVIVDVSSGASLPTALNEYSALMIIGGPQSANDTTATMKAELLLCQEALQKSLPYFGICLGHQILVKAAGGSVVKNPVREVGWIGPDQKPFRIRLTEAGKRDLLFAGFPDEFPVFQLHGEMVEVTQDTTVLATGDFCPIQAVRVGQIAYGLQFHFELNDYLYQCWINEDPDLRKLNMSELKATWQRLRPTFMATGKTLITNWLQQFIRF